MTLHIKFTGNDEEDTEEDHDAHEKTLKDIQHSILKSEGCDEEQSSFRIDAGEFIVQNFHLFRSAFSKVYHLNSPMYVVQCLAKRTLMRIRNKLQGFDDQSFSRLSVEGFVRLLITEAQDNKNLCKLYSGWAPW